MLLKSETDLCTTASAGRNVRWARMYSIGTGNREFWMHLRHMFSKKEFEGKGWLMRQKEELIWGRRGAEREHGTRSTARLLIFPFNHPASLARVRSALPSASLVPTDSSAGKASNTPRTALAKGGALGVPCPRDGSFLDPPWGPRSTVRTGRCNQPPSVAYPSSVGWKHNQWYHATHFDSFT